MTAKDAAARAYLDCALLIIGIAEDFQKIGLHSMSEMMLVVAETMIEKSRHVEVMIMESAQ